MHNSRMRMSASGWRNPYDFGWRRNVVAALGPPGRFGIQWLVPFSVRGRPGDGVAWKRVDEAGDVV